MQMSVDGEYEEDYPSGRAYLWFVDKPRIPEYIEVYALSGVSPGSNWSGVQVHSYDALLQLQNWLEEIGYKVNFDI